jgi:hypothetical protein
MNTTSNPIRKTTAVLLFTVLFFSQSFGILPQKPIEPDKSYSTENNSNFYLADKNMTQIQLWANKLAWSEGNRNGMHQAKPAHTNHFTLNLLFPTTNWMTNPYKTRSLDLFSRSTQGATPTAMSSYKGVEMGIRLRF